MAEEMTLIGGCAQRFAAGERRDFRSHRRREVAINGSPAETVGFAL